MKILAVIAAVLAVALLTGVAKFEFRWWTSDGASNIPAAKDVNRVIDAAYRDHLDSSLLHFYETVNRADRGSSEGAFLLQRAVPGLGSRIDEQITAARRRIAAVQLDTAAGRRFRGVVLRGLVLQGLIYRTFATDLERKRATWKAFDRWAVRFNALHRWYVQQFRSVLAVAAFEDRAAVLAALNRY